MPISMNTKRMNVNRGRVPEVIMESRWAQGKGQVAVYIYIPHMFPYLDNRQIGGKGLVCYRTLKE